LRSVIIKAGCSLDHIKLTLNAEADLSEVEIARDKKEIRKSSSSKEAKGKGKNRRYGINTPVVRLPQFQAYLCSGYC
jgi:hypothetical protein